MGVLDRYVLKKIFVSTLVILASCCAMLITVQILNRLDLLVKSTSAAFVAFMLILTVTPPIVIALLPLALLIAACRVLEDMQNGSELVVMAAAGRSNWGVAGPVLALGVGLASLCAFFSLYLEPRANRAQQEILTSATVDVIQFAVQTGTFVTVETGLLLKVKENVSPGTFSGVMIVDTRDPEQSQIYYARFGRLIRTEKGGRLVLINGELQIKTATDDVPSRVSFQSNVVELDTLQQAVGEREPKPRERLTGELIEILKNENYDRPREPLLIEFNRRMTDWMYLLVFALIVGAVSSNIRSHRADQTWRLTLAVLIGLAVRGPGFVFVNMSGQSTLMMGLAYLWPLGMAAIFLRLTTTAGRGRRSWIEAVFVAPVLSLLDVIASNLRRHWRRSAPR